MATETKFIKIEVNISDAVSELVKIQEEIKKLETNQKELNRTTVAGQEAYAKNTVALKEYRSQLATLVKETANEIKQGEQKLGHIQKLEAQVANLTIKYKQLSEAELGSDKGLTLLNNLKDKRAELAKLEQAYGNYSKNVGNYSSATNMLALNIGQVAKELPNFAISARIGIMSLTNNLPMLAEAIKAVRVEQAAMVAAGKQVPSMFSLITKSIFGLTGIVSLAMVLFQVFGEDILNAAKNLFGFGKAAEEAKFQQERLNTQLENSKMLMQEQIDIENIYAETNAERVRNQIKAEEDRWMKNEYLELRGLENNKRVGIKYNKERLAELSKMEDEHYAHMEKLNSDLRVAIERDNKIAADKKKEDDQKAAQEKEKRDKELERKRREQFDKELEEVSRLEKLKEDIITSQAEVILELEKSFSKKKVDDRNKDLIDGSRKALQQLKQVLDEEIEIDSNSVDEMLEKRKDFYKARINEADNEFATIQLKGQADLDAQFKLLDAKRDTEIFNAKLIGEDTTKITAYYEALKTKIKQDNYDSQLQSIASLFGSIGDMLEKDSIAQKVAATAQATINTYLGATSAYAQTVGGPVTKGLSAAAAIAAGLANVYQIWKVDTSVPDTNTTVSLDKGNVTKTEKFHTGGTIGGSGEVPITALGGESVMTQKATSMFSPLLSSINMMGGGKAITANVGGGSDGMDFMTAAFSRALQNMPAPVMSWREYETMKMRQQKLMSNRQIR